MRNCVESYIRLFFVKAKVTDKMRVLFLTFRSLNIFFLSNKGLNKKKFQITFNSVSMLNNLLFKKSSNMQSIILHNCMCIRSYLCFYKIMMVSKRL